MSGYKTYDNIKEELNIVRQVFNKMHQPITYSQKSFLNESVDDVSGDSVPYTKQDELFNSIIETCKTQFGADFSKTTNPMLYFPKGEDIKISGEIPLMDDAKFQFSYKDSDGCQVWVDPLKLNDETLDKMRLILGVYKNWKKEVLQYGDYKPMSINQSEQNQEQTNLQPGDDAELANSNN